jgi:carbon-monoxide dehydrogenase small subunit
MTRTIELIVDGKPHLATIEERWTLIELLRSGLSLLETEEGCGEGACGSCSVLVDGELVRSCLYLAVRAEGRVVQTVAGLATEDRLSPCKRPSWSTALSSVGFAHLGS